MAYCAHNMMPGFHPSSPVQHWNYPGAPPQHGHMEMNGMPPISAMLMREADAWRALMGLHGCVVNLSRNVSSLSSSEVDELAFDEKIEASDQRQAAYLASLSQLCAASDGLVAEATKVRGLRKAKHQLEDQALRDVLRAHSDETLATGDAIARSSSLGIAAATSELRQISQSMRTQIQQTRALMAAVSDVRALGNIDPDAKIVMGWVNGNGDAQQIRPVSKILEQVYQRGALTDENLAAAIWEGDIPQPEPPQNRVFSRRAGDRHLQQQLVASSGDATGSDPV